MEVITEQFVDDGNIKYVGYTINNVERRLDFTNPSFMKYIKDGTEWFLEKEIYRDENGKIYKIIKYYKNGNIKYETYKKDGKMHNIDDNPAYIDYYPEGNKKTEIYYNNDKYYRDYGNPHKVLYSEDGVTETYIWYDENYNEVRREVADGNNLVKPCRD